MIKIAVVEDDKDNADELYAFLERFSQEKHLELSVSVFSNAVMFLEKYQREFNLILMDIDLPNLDGMSAVKKLRTIDDSVMVIFVTNLAQYAVKGYEVGAFDFIVKPVSYYNLVLKLTRALDKMHTKEGKSIWVSTRQNKKLIQVRKLIYVEVIQHKLIFHTTEGDISVNGSLTGVKEDLKDQPFEQHIFTMYLVFRDIVFV